MKKSTAWLTCEACGKTKRQTTNLKKKKLTHTDHLYSLFHIPSISNKTRKEDRNKLVNIINLKS